MSEHYFANSPAVASDPRPHTFHMWDREWSVTTDHGVFSPGGLDKGTAVLLRKVPINELPAGALVADVGCGWGPITLALAEAYPDARVLATDVNERALELTARNAADLGYSQIEVKLADPLIAQLREEIAAGKCAGIDLIWSNPPIRIGKEALHELLKTWLGLLAPTGEAFLVVQKNLGADSLSAWITAQGFPTAKLGSSKGFRILHVRAQ